MTDPTQPPKEAEACSHCPRGRAATGHRRCEECLAVLRQEAAARRADQTYKDRENLSRAARLRAARKALIAAGLCRDCGATAVAGGQRCEGCGNKYREYAREYKRAQRAETRPAGPRRLGGVSPVPPA